MAEDSRDTKAWPWPEAADNYRHVNSEPEPHDATSPESLPPQAREVAVEWPSHVNLTPVMVPGEIADILRQAIASGRFLLLLTRADDERGDVLTVNRYRSGGFNPDWQLRAWQESGRQIMGAGLRPGAE